MSAAPAIIAPIPETLDRRLSIAQVEARRSSIVELMRKTMRENVDYGTIPGTPKPTLYKPGAEKVCSLFQLAPRVHVADLGTPDSVRYQVRVELYTASGQFCGEGVGTASSAETKYQWRAVVCREEFDATPEDRRRTAYKKKRDGGFFTALQVRTEPEDADNTVLKMAKKRALIDAVLTVTAASDIFTQDLEDPDAPPENGDNGHAPPRQPPQRTTAAPAQPRATQATPAQQRPAGGGPVISEAQQRRFYALANRASKQPEEVKQYLFQRFKLEHLRDLLRSDYEEACGWADGTAPQAQREPGEDEPLEPQDGDPGITDQDLGF